MVRLSAVCLSVVLTVAATFLAPSVHAQQPGQGPPMPVGMDLNKVPMGSWATYTVTLGKMPPMKTKISLVGRGPKVYIVEMAVEGGMMAMTGGGMVMQIEVDSDLSKDAVLKKLIMQMGQHDPMEMSVSDVQQKQFQKPNPKSLVKEETVKVAAGSYKAKHYRDKTPKGDPFDYWVSDKAPPFGLVKMVGENKNAPAAAAGPVTFELTELGTGAKAAITKKAKPFDQAALMGQIMGARGGQPGTAPGRPAAGAGGPMAPPPAAPAKN